MCHGFLFGREHVGPLAATPADPPPASNDRSFAEQGRSDGEHVIARHVAAGIDAATMEVERYPAHVENLPRWDRPRPTRVLNPSQSIDSSL